MATINSSHNRQAFPLIFIVLLLLVGGGLTISGVGKNTAPANPNKEISVTPGSGSETGNQLQLNSFNPLETAVTPTPNSRNNTSAPPATTTIALNMCPGPEGKALTDLTCICGPDFKIECKRGQCVQLIVSNLVGISSCSDIANKMNLNLCAMPNMAAGKDGVFCLGKPVIYLYPKHPMLVNVSVQTTGEIVVSDPHYPDGGWKNVFAEPSGKLTYQGKNYTELFYEANVKDFGKPTAGITLESKNVQAELDSIITKLGLVGSEKTEFLDWWVPKLEALNSKYIFFSILETKEKEKIDHVSYNPEPTTRIEFIAYFKPLQKPFEGKMLELPSAPPQRTGFTAVEWGGVIDDTR